MRPNPENAQGEICEPLISMAVAVADNGVIGQGGQLPWHIHSDMVRFRDQTLRKPIIMGRRTHESIGRVLPMRTNIVITRNEDMKAKSGLVIVHSVAEALERAREIAMKSYAREIVVVGGVQVYAATFPLVSKIYMTWVHASPHGDAHFPETDFSKWKISNEEFHERTRRDDYATTTCIITRSL